VTTSGEEAHRHARWFRSHLTRWGRDNRRDFPWRGDDNPYRVLVSEILLQRSRSSTVARLHPIFFSCFPTLERLAGADSIDVRIALQPLGLVRRADSLVQLARKVITQGGAIPTGIDDLMELPGVGPYVANATSSALTGRKARLIDGVSARVYRRFYFGRDAPGEVPRRELEDMVERVAPKRGSHMLNWTVLDLSAAVCMPRRPRCDVCPLARRCSWRTANTGLRRPELTIESES